MIKYRKWGRVFSPIRRESGRWFIGGRKAFCEVYPLDRLGTFATEIEAQAALDAWARKAGAVKVAPAGFVRVVQGRLF